jgi:hypothetical protein
MESAVEEMLRYDGVVQATFPAMTSVSLAAANILPSSQ